MKKLSQFTSFLLVSSAVISSSFINTAIAEDANGVNLQVIPRPVKVIQVDVGTEYRERFLPVK